MAYWLALTVTLAGLIAAARGNIARRPALARVGYALLLGGFIAALILER